MNDLSSAPCNCGSYKTHPSYRILMWYCHVKHMFFDHRSKEWIR